MFIFDEPSGVEAIAWARRVIADRGFHVGEWFGVGRGSQGHVLGVRVTGPRGSVGSLALKIFSGACLDAVRNSQQEFALLVALHDEAPSVRAALKLRSPIPVAVADGLAAYLMSYEHGRRIDDAISRGWLDATAAAAALVALLRAYHVRTGTAFGDWTIDNVIAAPDGLVVIDPGAASNDLAPPGGSITMLGQDLGYWLQDLAGKSLRHSVSSPGLLTVRVELARRMFAATRTEPPSPPTVNAEAAIVARHYLHGYGLGRPLVRRLPRLLVGEAVIRRVVTTSRTRRRATSDPRDGE